MIAGVINLVWGTAFKHPMLSADNNFLTDGGLLFQFSEAAQQDYVCVDNTIVFEVKQYIFVLNY